VLAYAALPVSISAVHEVVDREYDHCGHGFKTVCRAQLPRVAVLVVDELSRLLGRNREIKKGAKAKSRNPHNLCRRRDSICSTIGEPDANTRATPPWMKSDFLPGHEQAIAALE
jgi:hypothetical protein